MSDRHYEFAADTAGTINLARNERIALLAVCLAHQQSAGFGLYLDLRQFECPDCGAVGFNTGWGALRFTCQAEIVGDEFSEPCKATEAA